jgi:branched-chain amino acid transport system permease protein
VSLFVAAVFSGIALGFLLGLLGFGIVLLYKATGVANFAQGVFGCLGAFFIYKLVGAGLSPWPAFVLAILLMAGVCALFYFLVFRPRDDADHFNLTIRTLGLQMLILALIHKFWATGQPFAFPELFPGGSAIQFGSTVISWLTFGTIGMAVVFVTGSILIFRYTRAGLLFLAVSERPDIARMLGVRTRVLTLIAWMIAGSVSVIVGALLAPHALLSSDMMDPYLLLGFTAVVLGGLTSLYGVFLGGIIVGVTNNIIATFVSGDAAVLTIFLVLLVILRFRPQGIFGSTVAERF